MHQETIAKRKWFSNVKNVVTFKILFLQRKPFYTRLQVTIADHSNISECTHDCYVKGSAQ